MQLKALELGSYFTYAGKQWILLDRRDDLHLCLAVEPVGSRQYDRGKRARFEESSLCAWLNEEYFRDLLQAGGKTEDITSMQMNLSISRTDRDCIRVPHVGLLSWHQRIHYDALIPRVWKWEWSCTISEGVHGKGLRCIAGKPATYAYYPPNHPDPIVRPAAVMKGEVKL